MTRRFLWIIIPLLAAAIAACGPEDWTVRLPYAGPVEIAVQRGEFLPGTDIQYLGETERGAQVLIGDAQASKEIGDSLDWEGQMVGQVSVDQTLRVIFFTEQTLQTAGTVRVVVSDPMPTTGPADVEAPVHFKLPIGYRVDQGQAIPGTPITYLGQAEEGAELGNVEGYPYRKLGDSIQWEGRLRDGIWLQLNARTAFVTEERLDIVGTADLWIRP
jgi:hypothetical protein